MDLTQRKLNKSEWDSIEVPVSQSEQKILKLIIAGFNDVNIKLNEQKSLISFLKIEYNEKMEDYLYNKYFRSIIEDLIKKYSADYINVSVSSDIKIKSADKIRLEKNTIDTINQDDIFEYILISHLEKIIKTKFDNSKYAKSSGKFASEIEKNNNLFMFHYFTIFKLIRNNIIKINRHILSIINSVLENFQDEIDTNVIVENAVDFIEKNQSLLKYADMELYGH